MRLPAIASPNLDDRGAGTILFAMKAIVPPPAGTAPDRFLRCQEAIADGVSDVALAAVSAGWCPEEVAAALVELSDNIMLGMIANRDVERDLSILKRR